MPSNTRREFVKATAVGLATNAAISAADPLPRRKLGNTGLEVSVLGLGGGRVGKLDDGAAAGKVIRRCYDLGINYFDSAAAGAYGLSQARYGKALAEIREKLVYGTKTRHRTWEQSEIDLNQSLSLLKTDRIDLYQIHNVLSDEDIENIFRPRGVMEMIENAKKAGKIRFVGVTGHASPAVMTKVLARYDFDTVLIPLSVTDGAAAPDESFEKTTLPLARKKGMGVIAMKTLGAGRILRDQVVSLDDAVAYALSLPVATAIMGCDAVPQVEDDVRIARAARPMDTAQMDRLRSRAARFQLAHLEPWKLPPDKLTGERVYRAD